MANGSSRELHGAGFIVTKLREAVIHSTDWVQHRTKNRLQLLGNRPHALRIQLMTESQVLGSGFVGECAAVLVEAGAQHLVAHREDS